MSEPPSPQAERGHNQDIAGHAQVGVAVAGDVHGSIHMHMPPQAVRPAALHQLPAPTGDFVGRRAQIEQLCDALSSGSHAIICGLAGMGGLGKTTLALVVSQQVLAQYPDAQIMLDLQGSRAQPLSAVQALQRVLGDFHPNVPLPDDAAQLGALYRSTLAERRVLLLADDASSAAQVRALIPPAGSALLLTSRTHFLLAGMTFLRLDTLEQHEAIALLRQICPRLNEIEAAQIASACGCLPLALRIAGSLLEVDPSLKLAAYLAHLADERRKLAALRDPDDPNLDVAASLALSYTQLDTDQQRVFCQLGVFAASFDLTAAAAVLDEPDEEQVAAHLTQLCRRSLLEYQPEQDRYALHELVRVFALAQFGEAAYAVRLRHAQHDVAVSLALNYAQLDTDQQRVFCQLGVFAASFDLAAAAAVLDEPDAAQVAAHLTQLYRRSLLEYQPEQDRYALHELVRVFALAQLGEAAYVARLRHARHYISSADQADNDYLAGGEQLTSGLAQFDRERANLDAARRWLHQQTATAEVDALLIADADATAYISELRYAKLQERLPQLEQALAAARRSGRRDAEGRCLGNLGLAYAALGEPQRAIEFHQQALLVSRELGDRYAEGHTLGNLGNAYYTLGEPQRAIAYYEQQLVIVREIGDRRGEGSALGSLGIAYAALGEPQRAMAYYAQHLVIARTIGDRQGEANSSWNYGRLLVQQGEVAEGVTLLAQGQAFYQEIGHPRASAWAETIAYVRNHGKLPGAESLNH